MYRGLAVLGCRWCVCHGDLKHYVFTGSYDFSSCALTHHQRNQALSLGAEHFRSLRNDTDNSFTTRLLSLVFNDEQWGIVRTGVLGLSVPRLECPFSIEGGGGVLPDGH